jgi:hypothetical protein
MWQLKSLIIMHKNITLAILVAGMAFSFYLFQLRPTQIRKECWSRVEKIKSGETKSDKFVSDEFQATLGNKQAIDTLYSNCLREKGL